MKLKHYKKLSDEEIIEELKNSSREEVFSFLTKNIFYTLLEKLRPAIEIKNLEFEGDNIGFKSYTVPIQHYLNGSVTNIYTCFYAKNTLNKDAEEQLKILIDINKLILYSNFSLEKQYEFLNFCMKLFSSGEYNEKLGCIKIYDKLVEILDNSKVEEIINNTKSKLPK